MLFGSPKGSWELLDFLDFNTHSMSSSKSNDVPYDAGAARKIVHDQASDERTTQQATAPRQDSMEGNSASTGCGPLH
eukprot:3803388-Karenia_brevis.AAC.1